MRYTVEEICRIIEGEAPGLPPALAFEDYTIDSRVVKPGDLFFAFKGPNRDGHDFVPEALAKGAGAAVIQRGIPIARGAGRFISCDEPLGCLHKLASHSRDEPDLKLIGITGSCGKTTTKDLTAAMLSERFRTGKNRGNLNNIWGLPPELLRREPELDVYVCEMGMSYAGELGVITQIARPDIAVFTNIHPVHLDNFSSFEEIVSAKAEVLEGMPDGGPVVANADDPVVMKIALESGRPITTYGRSAEADVRLVKLADKGLGGLRCELAVAGESLRLTSPLPGIYNLYNVMAGLAAGLVLGIGPANMLAGLSKIEMSPYRSRLLRLGGNVTLFDDAYNSNPEAMRRVLDMLGRTGGYARKVAVLGDMLELGPAELEEHARIGPLIPASGVEALVAVGPLAAAMAAAAMAAGLRNGQVARAADAGAALAAALELIRPGDLVLVKGSRGVKLETVVAGLTRHFGAATENSEAGEQG